MLSTLSAMRGFRNCSALTRWRRLTSFGMPAMVEFHSACYTETLANMRAKRLADPEFWEHNATLHREPIFAQACLNYARKLRNG